MVVFKKPKISKILLINAPRGYISSEYGLGYQLPLGLVLIGGPLVDAGYEVKLLDADAKRMNIEQVVSQARQWQPHLIGISHTGSTAAHPQTAKVIKALKTALPETLIVYGGVYPSFAFRYIMQSLPEVDIIVRGEGEQITLELLFALNNNKSLREVKGLVWRDNGSLVINKAAPLIQDLDRYRPGWELVDWSLYKLLGWRSAGVQFSRGCPNSCDFCGQWIFWKRYRHRSPELFVAQIKELVTKYKVEHIWPADEHFCADRESLIKILNGIIKEKIKVSLSINASVDSILRDKDILYLYKKAGIDFIALGVESDNDEVVQGFGKSSFQMASEALRLLKKHSIISCANVIFGLENETFTTIWKKFWRLRRMDPDFVNATYLTPHFWTPRGAKVPLEAVIQPDQSKWGYRNQVIHTPHLAPWQLFLGVKLTEFFLHIRPSRLWRTLLTFDKETRKFSRRALYHAFIVWLVETFYDFPKTKFVAPGEFKNCPQAKAALLPRNS